MSTKANPTTTQTAPATVAEAPKDAVQKEEIKIAEGNIRVRPFVMGKDNIDDYMTMGQVAKTLGVRFQQVYQRSERGKLGTLVVLFDKKLIAKSEVAKWQVARKEYFEKQDK